LDQASPSYRTHAITLDVLYADTDAMGIVYYANYLRFFEAGRLGYICAFAEDHARWVPEGVRLPVTQVNCRYRRPAQVFERITVETVLQNVKRASFGFAYRILRGGELLVEGETDHAYTDETGRVRRFDERILRFLANARQ
jgi:acyl-CoA thioester hydrolase